MRTLLFITTLLSLLFLNVQAQSVQSMVKNQPFPYRSGVAMDTTLYASVKAKLVAADSLRIRAQRSIVALQAQIEARRQEKEAIARIGQYDAGKVDLLSKQLDTLQAKLGAATTDLQSAKTALSDVVDELPRKVRKSLVGATSDQIATAVVDYVHTLQHRKWTWSVTAATGGFLLGVLTILF